MNDKQRKLIEEYIEITGTTPSPALHSTISYISQKDEDYYWQETTNPEQPYKLAPVEPLELGIPVPNPDIGPDSEPILEAYKPAPLDIPGAPEGMIKSGTPEAIRHLDILKQILPEKVKEKLLIGHEPGSSSTAKQVLEGFGIDRLIEAYADGVSDEGISSYLNIRPSQLKQWIVSSTQRMGMVQRLQDILRAKDINKIIGESFEYEVGEIMDKADAAYESLKLDCMKMKSKVALDLEGRARIRQQEHSRELPVVNLGIQVNVGEGEKNEVGETKVVPVLPKF